MPKHCPKCGIILGDSDNFCGQCGGPLSPGLPPGEESKEEGAPPRLHGVLGWLLDTFLGAGHKNVLIVSLAFIIVGVCIFGAGAFTQIADLQEFPSDYAPYLWLIGLLLYWLGLMWLMSGELCQPLEALGNLTANQWCTAAVLTTLLICMLPLAARLFGD